MNKLIDKYTTMQHISKAFQATFLTSLIFFLVAVFFIFTEHLTINRYNETIVSLYVLNWFTVWVSLYFLDIDLFEDIEKNFKI